jgi:hypothetical protein
VKASSILPASLPAFDESIVLSGIHATTRFYGADGREDVGRRELRRFGNLAGSVVPDLTLAPDDATPLQTAAGEALAQINGARRRR